MPESYDRWTPRLWGEVCAWHPSVVTLTIRRASATDEDAVLTLAGRAWEPVFASVNLVLGPELARSLHGEDWRTHHAAEVATILAGMTAWVAERGTAIVGFAAARIADPGRRIGEVHIVGVDPDAQRTGVAAALVRHAEEWLREQGMAVIFIGTGGDPGHAPARSLYSSLGYRPFPVVQHYKRLDAED
jgi:GNAT superfamily N-acetyltransferase